MDNTPFFEEEHIRRKKPPSDILKPEGYTQNFSPLLLSTLSINILSLALPIMTLQVYDRILPNTGTGTLSILIFGVCVAIFLEMVLRLSRAYVIGRTGAQYEHLIACKAMDKVLNSDLSQTKNYGIGEHLNRLSSVGKLKDFYNGHAFSTLCDLAFIPVFLLLIFYIATPLIVIPVFVLSIFIPLSVFNGYRLREALEDRERSDDIRFNFLVETLEGVHTVKAFALEKFFERRYECFESSSTFANYRVTEATSKIFNNGAIFSHIMVAGIISYGALCVLHGQITTGGLIASLLLSGRMMQPIQKALGLWVRYQDYILARTHLEDLFKTPQQNLEYKVSSKELKLPEGEVTLSDVTFKYDSSSHHIFKNLNLDIKRKECVLLTGSHGAGKTGLLHLIAGLYSPTSGRIEIDGLDIQKYHADDLLRYVGYVRTHPLIFRGTIRENMSCFGQIPESQVQEISGYLDVDKEIAKLPSGLDTYLNGDHTDFIPIGLQQKISIIRALALKPKIILFDNADRFLDKEGYLTIFRFLARLKGKATLILVSDDLNISNLADRTYRIKDQVLHMHQNTSGEKVVVPYRELRL